MDTYLDHFLMCSRNPANPSDGLAPPQSCMSRGGIPVQPYFVLGGFVDENATHFPKVGYSYSSWHIEGFYWVDNNTYVLTSHPPPNPTAT